MHVDRRIARTRRGLLKALGELLEEKSFDSIAVSEIAERADINRATFYRHYEDKQDLLSRGIDQLIDDITARLDAETSAMQNPKARIVVLLAEIEKDFPAYRPFFSTHAPPEFSRRFERRVSSYIFEQRLLPFVEEDMAQKNLAFLSRITTGVLTSVLSSWFRDIPEKSHQEVAELYLRFITSGIAGFLSQEKAELLCRSIHKEE